MKIIKEALTVCQIFLTEEKSQKDQVVTASKPSKPLLTGSLILVLFFNPEVFSYLSFVSQVSLANFRPAVNYLLIIFGGGS